MTRKGKPQSRISFPEIFLILLSVAIAAAGIYLLFGGRNTVSRTDVLEQRLRDLRQLKTVSQSYRSVIFVEDKSFWLGTKQVLFTLEYEVTAGVDFSLGIEIRRMPDGGVTVRMPAAQIFSSDADESTIREMFLREQPFFNPVRMGDYIPQVIAQGEANRTAALEGGILNRAESNARLAVIRVLQLADVQNIVFGPPLASGSVDG